MVTRILHALHRDGDLTPGGTSLLGFSGIIALIAKLGGLF